MIRFGFLIAFICLVSRVAKAQTFVYPKQTEVGYYYSKCTGFMDSVGLYANQSVKSRRIAVVRKGDWAKTVYDGEDFEQKVDSVSGRKYSWSKVEFEGQIGFVKNYELTGFTFKSHTNTGVSFNVGQDWERGELIVNVFEKGRWKMDFRRLERNVGPNWAFSVGKISGDSLGHDIIAIGLGAGDMQQVLVLRWDGKQLSEYKDKLNEEIWMDNRPAFFVNGDNVNMRKEPSIKSAIVAKLDYLSPLTEVKEDYIQEQLEGEYYNWVGVNWKGQKGFISHTYVSHNGAEKTRVNSLALEGISYRLSEFTMKDENRTRKGVVEVYKNGVEVDKMEFRPLNRAGTLFTLGQMGLKNVKEVISVCYSAESCGESGGDVYFAWDGKKLVIVGVSSSVGDGAWGGGSCLYFPAQYEGEANRIVRKETEGESLFFNESELGYKMREANYVDVRRVYSFENGKLTELPSVSNSLEKLAKKQSANNNLLKSTLGDFDQDALKGDAAFLAAAQEPVANAPESTEQVFTLFLAMQKGVNDFELLTSNSKLIGPNLGQEFLGGPVVEFSFKKHKLELELLYSNGGDANKYDNYFLTFDFVKATNKVILSKAEYKFVAMGSVAPELIIAKLNPAKPIEFKDADLDAIFKQE